MCRLQFAEVLKVWGPTASGRFKKHTERRIKKLHRRSKNVAETEQSEQKRMKQEKTKRPA